MSVRARFRRWWVVSSVAVLLVAAACDGSGSSGSSGSSGGASPSATVTTTDVALPEGDEPVVVTPWGDDLLVGSRAPEGSASRPRLTGGSRAALADRNDQAH